MQNMDNFHAFVFVVSKRVTSLKMTLQYRCLLWLLMNEYLRTSVLQSTCFFKFGFWFILTSETAICRYSSKQIVFLNIFQYSQKNNCAGALFNKAFNKSSFQLKARVLSCDYSKCFFYRAPLVAASVTFKWRIAG